MQSLTILTGASRGMGLAMAQQLLQPGALVLCISRQRNAGLQAQAEAAGAVLEQWSADLAEGGPVAQRLGLWLGAMDPKPLAGASLINNAGVISPLVALRDSDPAALAQALRSRGLHLATAESCTGGLIAAACTALPGSSEWFERGFVVYSNESKADLLGVPAAAIAEHGAVSEVVARAMAEGALRRSRAQLSVAVTGVAGPGGGSADKPVGLVHFGAVGPAGAVHVEHRFGNLGREEVRLASVRVALQLLLDRIAT
jgi:nicotinamide-nucleotide amidase